MKLVLAVVQNQNAGPVLEKLLEKGLRATKLASTGGFLRQGNTTFLIGVENERVPEVIEILQNTCGSRQGRGQIRATTGAGTGTEPGPATGADPSPRSDANIAGTGMTPGGAETAGAIVFVLNVSRFDRI